MLANLRMDLLLLSMATQIPNDSSFFVPAVLCYIAHRFASSLYSCDTTSCCVRMNFAACVRFGNAHVLVGPIGQFLPRRTFVDGEADSCYNRDDSMPQVTTAMTVCHLESDVIWNQIAPRIPPSLICVLLSFLNASRRLLAQALCNDPDMSRDLGPTRLPFAREPGFALPMGTSTHCHLMSSTAPRFQ